MGQDLCLVREGIGSVDPFGYSKWAIVKSCSRAAITMRPALAIARTANGALAQGGVPCRARGLSTAAPRALLTGLVLICP